MTPDERQMISDLFDRLRSMGGQEKDREAEAYIAQLMRQTPDSAYLLAQNALMQGFELQQAGDRIAELEQQLASTAAPAQRGGGSFLGRGAAAAAGGALGAGAIGARANPMVYGQQEQPAAQPWGNASTGFQGRGAGAPQTVASMPPAQAVPPVAQPQRSGGFLKGAMAAAAGVAGGVLLADSIRGMFGGSSAQASQSNNAGNTGWTDESDKASADSSYKDEDGSNDQGDSGWSDGGSDIET